MSKSVRVLSLVVLLLSVIAVNVVADEMEIVAEATKLPCFDAQTRCLQTHSFDYCFAYWCGCMDATYGGTNC